MKLRFSPLTALPRSPQKRTLDKGVIPLDGYKVQDNGAEKVRLAERRSTAHVCSWQCLFVATSALARVILFPKWERTRKAESKDDGETG